ncbi:MAG: hypothetical protein HWN65_24170 [Candidatus Helarchaeota archaeon]|nr:hypothetical protein [Candidatus Helarchaeota archaeon]
MWNLTRLFRKPNPNEVRIPIRQVKANEYQGKTYYRWVASISKKLKSGKGQFKLVLSNRAKYLLLTFE